MENSKKFFLFVFLVLTGLVVVGLFISDNLGFSGGSLNQGTCSGNLDVLSISSVDYRPGEGKVYVNAVVNNGGQCIKIAWNPTDITKYLKQNDPDNYVENGVYGTISLVKQTQRFSAKPVSMLLSYATKNYDLGLGIWRCNVDWCRNRPEEGLRNSINAIKHSWDDCLCIYRYQQGDLAEWTGKEPLDFEANVHVSGLPSATLSGAKQSVWLSDKVFVKYVGGLIGLEWVSPPNAYHPFYDGTKYIMIDTARWEFDREYQRVTNCVTTAGLFDVDEVYSCITNYDNKIDDYTDDKSNEYEQWMSGTVRDTVSAKDGIVLYLEPIKTWRPQFQIILDAEWVGVKDVKGKPEVSGCPTTIVKSVSGMPKEISFTVQNKARTSGAFSFSLVCDGVNQDLSKYSDTFDSFESKGIKGYPSISTSETIKKGCRFTAYVTRDPSIRDYCDFNLEVTPGVQCSVPGVTKCENNNLKTCGDDYQWHYTRCKEKCDLKEGKYGCLCETDAGCEEGEICEDGMCIKEVKECKNCFSWLGNLLDIKECQPKPADKVMWIIPVPLTSQDSVCPVYLIVVFGIIGLFVTLIIILIRRRYKK